MLRQLPNVLSGVLTSGTGRYAYNLKTFNQPVAGKTGTSDNSEDLWFCAYTPQLATVAGVDIQIAVTLLLLAAESPPPLLLLSMFGRTT